MEVLPVWWRTPKSEILVDSHSAPTSIIVPDHYNIRLGLDRPTPGDIINILSRCSGLEQLTLMHDDNSKSLPSTDSSNEPIHLPNLVSFRFGSSPHISTPRPSFIKICSGIRAPLVENINCPTLSNSFLPLIGNANPFPGLQKLRLHHHGWSAGERDLQFYGPGVFENAFFNLQSLSNLVFLRQKIPTCAFRALHHHCPILIHLALDGCDFITADCVKLVEARKKSSAVTSLQRLRIQDRQYNIPSPPDRSQEAIWFRANVTEFFYGSFEGGFRDA
ncbi:hypothetical protein FRC03_007970 [Tulasnella sp. 419]|nr:hypothetical protein FRC03_007970 [Tulasnella sp. 419]